MPLMLTSRGIIGNLHRKIENGGPARTAAVTATAAAVGLAAGRSKSVRHVPAGAVAAGGLILSYLGMSGVGDGLAAAGATVIGYRLGATGSVFRRRRSAASAASVPPAPVPERVRRRG